MKVNRWYVVLSFAMLLGLAANTYADQLDQDAAAQAPEGVVVKVDPQTKTVTLYKSKDVEPMIRSGQVDKMSDAQKTAVVNTVLAKVVRPENKIGEFKQNGSELDHDSSTSAWWGRGWGRGWGGGCGRGWGWNNWGGWGGSCWSQPWYYPGQIYYNNYYYSNNYYNYGWGYGCGGCNYGWYW